MKSLAGFVRQPKGVPPTRHIPSDQKAGAFAPAFPAGWYTREILRIFFLHSYQLESCASQSPPPYATLKETSSRFIDCSPLAVTVKEMRAESAPSGASAVIAR